MLMNVSPIGFWKKLKLFWALSCTLSTSKDRMRSLPIATFRHSLHWQEGQNEIMTYCYLQALSPVARRTEWDHYLLLLSGTLSTSKKDKMRSLPIAPFRHSPLARIRDEGRESMLDNWPGDFFTCNLINLMMIGKKNFQFGAKTKIRRTFFWNFSFCKN